MKKNLKLVKSFIICCALFCVAILGIISNINLSYAQTLENVLIERGNVANQVMYLSDLTFTKAQVGWGNVSLDKTQSNTPLTLVVNGASTVFKKGIWAHATSTIEYDIREYKDYTYLTTYYGLNTTAQNNGNGVKFYIYTSVDGEEWTLKTEENPTALKGISEAGYAKVDIRGANYIRLYANDCGSNASDHAIWADSKLVKDGYSDDIMIGLDKFDSYIKANYKGGEVKPELRLAVLQRNLLRRMGQYQLRQFIDSDPKHRETFEWFIYNEEALRLWTIGGTPNGSYTRALEVLSNLYQAHKEDLENENTTANGTKYKDLYLKMMLALSLTHSTNIGLWIGGNQLSDAVTRYEIYKQMHLDNKLLSNSVFENLTVEEMRWVMHVNIDDEEILWFRDYSAKRYPDLVQRFSPYGYVRYTKGYGYYRPQYYSQENYAKWDQKYNLSKYNITYQAGKPKLWIVFEEGAVCGGISKTAANLYGAWGMPASVVGQPGHAAYIYYYDVGGKGAWQLSYNVAATGWANTSGYSRMPNDWGNLGSGVVTNTANIKSASYFFLAQEAQNEYEKYEKAQMILLLENIYKDDNKKLMKIYRDALEQEGINWYAWLGIVNLYLKDTSKTQKDFIALAEEIAEAIPYHPLPMYDLTRRIGTKITSPEYRAQLMMVQEQTLRKATKATSANTLQYKEVPVVAQALLGEINSEIATFSFNGANANKITLSKQLQSTQVSWSYSLDGGRTWKDCYEHSAELTAEEIASIDVDNDIKVHISGLDYSAANIYTIDITKRTFPSGVITINDEEDRILGATSDMEWTLDPNAGWNSFANTNPIFSGNTRAYLRVTAAGTQLSSDPVYFTFKENNVDDTKWYVQSKNLKVYEVNASQTGNWTNMLDGNVKTAWRSKYGILPAYVTIESDIPRYISGIDYAPDPSAKKFNVIPFGRARKLNIYVSMDNQNWDLAATKDNLGDNDSIKHIDFPEPRKAKYVKIECPSIYSGDYTTFTVSIIKLYENVAVDETPRAEINYNIVKKTNQDVEAELINPTRNITVTNNGGKMTHTFTENGEFTFEFKDVNGNTGTATAKVDWIDKTKPTVNVAFNTTQITNDEVVATLTFDKEVTILSNDVQVAVNDDGSQTITFLENGEVELKFQDALGNIGTKLIKVDWIDTDNPTAEIEYSTTTLTDKKVTAKLKPSEPIIVLNNGGSDIYTFEDNGTFTFEFIDRAGNKGTATATVDWIAKVPKYEIAYSTKELTNKDVTVTITLEDGFRIVNNDAKNVYTYTDNGTFEFQYIDSKSHIGLIKTSVDWIDKTAPNAELKYTAENGKVIVTVVNPSEEITFKEGNGTYEYTESGTYEIVFYDKVGNEGKLSAVVEIKKDEEQKPEEKPTEPEKPEEGNKPSEGDKPSEEKPEDKPNPDTKPTNPPTTPSKPSTGNSTKPSNPSTTEKPEEKPEEKPAEVEYKKYETGKIKVEIPSTVLTQDGNLKSEEFSVSDDMKNRFGNASEYYEIYLTDSESKKINVNSPEAIKMSIKIDSSKDLLGIYEITENNVIKSIDFTKNGEDIVFKSNNLGKFVVSYKEKEMSNPTENVPQKENKIANFTIWIILSCAVIFIGISLTIVKFRK